MMRNQGAVPSFRSTHWPAKRKRTIEAANCSPTPANSEAEGPLLASLPPGGPADGPPPGALLIAGESSACEIFRKRFTPPNRTPPEDVCGARKCRQDHNFYV